MKGWQTREDIVGRKHPERLANFFLERVEMIIAQLATQLEGADQSEDLSF
jgi:hypothetical protein